MWWWWFERKESKRLINNKRQQRERSLKSTSYLLSQLPTSTPLPATSAAELRALIGEGKYSCTDVVKYWAAQALRAHQATNCLTEVMISDALSIAASMDKEQGKNELAVHTLLGIPISLKDNLNVEGHDSSIGYSCFTQAPALEDSALVKVIKYLGGIPLVKTNVPQTLLSFECSNPVWGTTLHPLSPKLTPGGSSGGEAALLASGGSILGVGTDIGGSLRIPAHFCGLVTLKGTSKRWPIQGTQSTRKGQSSIPSIIGPMARTVADCRYFYKAVIDAEPWKWDGDCVPLGWREPMPLAPSQVKIGYFGYDGYAPLSPACQRALDKTVQTLTQAGFQMVRFDPPDVALANEIFYGILSADGGDALLSPLRGDPLEPAVQHMRRIVRLWRPLRWLITGMLRWFNAPAFAALLKQCRPKSVKELWKLVEQQQAYKQRFHQAWLDAGLDLVICPVNSLPAVQHTHTKDAAAAASYTILWNVLDFPAGVIPITRVGPEDRDTPGQSWLGAGKTISWSESYIRGAYDVDVMMGAPVGVQIVGLPYQEEHVLQAMQWISDTLS